MTASRTDNRKSRRSFLADEDGAMIVEFAMIAPPMLFLLLAICQIALVFLTSLWLDNATTVLGREIRTGRAQGLYASTEAVKTAICDRAAGFISCGDRLLVDVRTLPAGPVNLAWPVDEEGEFETDDAYTPGSPGEIMLVRVFYQYPVLIPMFSAALSDMPNGNRLIVSSVAFRNEPFTVAAPPPPPAGP
jgi:Flp pilus assembly protein TadG